MFNKLRLLLFLRDQDNPLSGIKYSNLELIDHLSETSYRVPNRMRFLCSHQKAIQYLSMYASGVFLMRKCWLGSASARQTRE